MTFDEIMEKLSSHIEYAKDNYVPIIRPVSAKYLYDYIASNNIKRVLEIGTAIGYSGSIMMAGGVQFLCTIDINEKTQAMAKKTFETLGFADNIDVVCEDAKTVLPKLIERGEKYDMIFLDGAKGQYINYLPNLINLLDNNGVIFADNVLLQGMVESKETIPHRKRTMVVNLRKYLSRVNECDFETELVRIEDGMAISKYIGGK
jgi:predicted O-methyltransferase YrrM